MTNLDDANFGSSLQAVPTSNAPSTSDSDPVPSKNFEDDYCVFYNDSILADFSKCAIEFDGKSYPTVEHCVKLQMLQSMGLLRLVDQLRKIENVDLFRRKLREYLVQAYKDDKIADEVAEDWLLKNVRMKLKRANRIKFTTNIEARKVLLGTGDKVLVFASAHDRQGGIGMTVQEFIHFVRNHELRSDQFLSLIQSDTLRPKRLGHNWLGLVLMEIRAELTGKPVKLTDSHSSDQNLLELSKAIENRELERIREKQKQQLAKAAALSKQSAVPSEKPKKPAETGWALPTLAAEIRQHLGAEEELPKAKPEEKHGQIEEPPAPVTPETEPAPLPEKISPEQEMLRIFADVRTLVDLLVSAVHKAIPSVLIPEPPKPTVESKPKEAPAPPPEQIKKELRAPVQTAPVPLLLSASNSSGKPKPISLLSLFTNANKPSTSGSAQKSSVSWPSHSSKTSGAPVPKFTPPPQTNDLFKPPPPPPPKPPASLEEVQKTAEAIYNAIKEAQEMISKKDRQSEDRELISQWPPAKPKKDRKSRWTDADPATASGSNTVPLGGGAKKEEPPPAKRARPKTYYQLEPGEVPPPWWQPPLPTSMDPKEVDAPIPGERVDEDAPMPELPEKKRDITKIVDKSKGWNSEISQAPPPKKPLSVADLFASDMGKGLDPLNLEGFRHPGMDPYLFAPKAPQVGPRIPRDMLPKFYPPTVERGFQLPDFLTPDKINPDALAMMAKNYEEWLKTQPSPAPGAGLPLMGLPTHYPGPYDQAPKEETEEVEHAGGEKMIKKKKDYIKKEFKRIFSGNLSELRHFANRWVQAGRLTTTGTYEELSSDESDDEESDDEGGDADGKEKDDGLSAEAKNTFKEQLHLFKSLLEEEVAKSSKPEKFKVASDIIFEDTSKYQEYLDWYKETHPEEALELKKTGEKQSADEVKRQQYFRAWFRWYQQYMDAVYRKQCVAPGTEDVDLQQPSAKFPVPRAPIGEGQMSEGGASFEGKPIRYV